MSLHAETTLDDGPRHATCCLRFLLIKSDINWRTLYSANVSNRKRCAVVWMEMKNKDSEWNKLIRSLLPSSVFIWINHFHKRRLWTKMLISQMMFSQLKTVFIISSFFLPSTPVQTRQMFQTPFRAFGALFSQHSSLRMLFLYALRLATSKMNYLWSPLPDNLTN